MTQRTISSTIILLLIVLLSACGNDDSPAEDEVYEVQGRYLSTSVDGEFISVIHETIPDVMDAMRMSLRIDDPAKVEDLETGDIIRFEMFRDNGQWRIQNIEPLPEDTELDLPEDLEDIGTE